MHSFFTLSPHVLFLVFILIGVTYYAIGYGFLKLFEKQASKDVLTMPIGAFIGAVATAWALSLGFVAADIWAVNSRADHAASAERSSITRLLGMARADGLNAPELMHALTSYRVTVVKEEWAGTANARPMRAVEDSLQNIRVSLIKLARSDTPGSIMAQLVQDFDEMQDARNTRLAVGASSINHYKWNLVLFLTLLTLVVISAAHADRPKGGRKAMLLYTVTAVVSMWILAIHASPYRGVGRLEPTILFTSQKAALALPAAFHSQQ